MDNNKYELEVFKFESIGNMKLKLDTKMRIGYNQYDLIYDGEILENTRLVKKCCLVDNSVVDVVRKSRLNILCNFGSDCCEKVNILKDCTVADLKKELENKLQLDSSMQNLRFQMKLLDDESTLAECRIVENSNIYVERRRRISIFKKEKKRDLSRTRKSSSTLKLKYGKMSTVSVTIMDSKINMPVLEDDTIGEVRKKIYSAYEINEINQELSSEEGKELDDDNKTVLECGIREIRCRNVANIGVVACYNTDDRVRLRVSPLAPVSSLATLLEAESGLPSQDQVWFLDKTPLAAEVRISKCGVMEGSRLQVDINQLHIFVKLECHPLPVILKVPENANLGYLKKLLTKKMNINYDDHLLRFSAVTMTRDSRKLRDYGLSDNSEVDVIRYPETVTIMFILKDQSLVEGVGNNIPTNDFCGESANNTPRQSVILTSKLDSQNELVGNVRESSTSSTRVDDDANNLYDLSSRMTSCEKTIVAVEPTPSLMDSVCDGTAQANNVTVVNVCESSPSSTRADDDEDNIYDESSQVTCVESIVEPTPILMDSVCNETAQANNETVVNVRESSPSSTRADDDEDNIYDETSQVTSCVESIVAVEPTPSLMDSVCDETAQANNETVVNVRESSPSSTRADDDEDNIYDETSQVTSCVESMIEVEPTPSLMDSVYDETAQANPLVFFNYCQSEYSSIADDTSRNLDEGHQTNSNNPGS